MDPVLVMRKIVKDYPGVRALDGVDFTLEQGEVHALVGQNGAGKSTLIKILAGAERMDSGDIIIYGRPARYHTPLGALRAGIGTIYQELNLVPEMNAAENIYLGREPRGPLGWVRYAEMHRRAQELLQSLGTQVDVRRPISRLGVAERQMVEIAKALSQEARILIMDEPSATLTEREVELLFNRIGLLKQQGISIIYISHRLEEVFEVADRVTVLRDGRRVATSFVSAVDRQELVRLMVGRELAEEAAVEAGAQQGAGLLVTGLNAGPRVQDIDLRVDLGEVVGLAGLVGCGRSELCMALFGAIPWQSGRAKLGQDWIHLRSPQEAIHHGIGLIPSDRKTQGLILGMNVMANTSLPSIRRLSTFGVVSPWRERKVVQEQVKALDIRTPSINQLVRNLSGGTQQKVVLAKWLATRSKLLIFDEPTRGIDVGTKAELYHLIRLLAKEGVGVLASSSDLPELLIICDRIMVMRDGRIVGKLSRAEATQERILHLAMGTAEAPREAA